MYHGSSVLSARVQLTMFMITLPEVKPPNIKTAVAPELIKICSNQSSVLSPRCIIKASWICMLEMIFKQRLTLIDRVAVGVPINRPKHISLRGTSHYSSIIGRQYLQCIEERTGPILFCRSDQLNFYLTTIEQLDKDKTKPPGLHNLLEYR